MDATTIQVRRSPKSKITERSRSFGCSPCVDPGLERRAPTCALSARDKAANPHTTWVFPVRCGFRAVSGALGRNRLRFTCLLGADGPGWTRTSDRRIKSVAQLLWEPRVHSA